MLRVKHILASSDYASYRAYLAHPVFRACVAARRALVGEACEECGEAPASEPHHIDYPAWGAFDTPANIRLLCHACHSKHHVQRLLD